VHLTAKTEPEDGEKTVHYPDLNQMIKIVAPISNPKTELDEKEGDLKLVD